ncbi:hypothetical protein FNV43_RR07349 [Rhamnella rubrinervis]|uniref:Uncharacterized protein n=1 Tax=Rhamnella rubrinervis TaxID=2594499 RepID=A0A8K0HFK6_9ROSA|nr:hypothetical protein FNV43_RR07349 [Rhamnella rubrinervis]
MAPAVLVSSILSTVKRPDFSLSHARDDFQNVSSSILYRNPLPWTPSYRTTYGEEAGFKAESALPNNEACVFATFRLWDFFTGALPPNYAFILTCRSVTIDKRARLRFYTLGKRSKGTKNFSQKTTWRMSRSGHYLSMSIEADHRVVRQAKRGSDLKGRKPDFTALEMRLLPPCLFDLEPASGIGGAMSAASGDKPLRELCSLAFHAIGLSGSDGVRHLMAYMEPSRFGSWVCCVPDSCPKTFDSVTSQGLVWRLGPLGGASERASLARKSDYSTALVGRTYIGECIL